MASRVDTITQHIFSFDDNEITIILNALYDACEDDLANEIYAELPCGCDVSVGSFDENKSVEELIESIKKFTEGK